MSDFHELPYDLASALSGICTKIHFKELPGGSGPDSPGLANVRGSAFFSEDGVAAYLEGLRTCSDPSSSGFYSTPDSTLDRPLDNVFGIACMWAQKYRKILAFPSFPIEFKQRHILHSLNATEAYFIKIIPVSLRMDFITFDIWIYDLSGTLYEAILGVRMQARGTNGGVIISQWMPTEPREGLGFIRQHCVAFALIELDAVAPFAPRAFSQQEQEKFQRLGQRRKRSYTAARLAAKHLSRKLGNNDGQTPAHEINTIAPDQIRPQCPLPDGRDLFTCSISHSSRFAIAVAGHGGIGVDVEEISEKVLMSQNLYLNAGEKSLVHHSPMGAIQASLRVWSLKEAVAKALNIPLTEAWQRTRVLEVQWNMSSLEIGAYKLTAFHDTLDNHLFSLTEIN